MSVLPGDLVATSSGRVCEVLWLPGPSGDRYSLAPLVGADRDRAATMGITDLGTRGTSARSVTLVAPGGLLNALTLADRSTRAWCQGRPEAAATHLGNAWAWFFDACKRYGRPGDVEAVRRVRAVLSNLEAAHASPSTDREV